MSKRIIAFAALALIAGPSLAATEIGYWLWDEQQKPAYQACAATFQKKHPDIQVKITQNGWNDYWTALTTGFVSGTAPDVFTDHVSRYPEYAANGLIVDLAPLIAKDRVATDVYTPGLLSVWQRQGKTYGLPKDWDTIALVYNDAMLRAAGVTRQQLEAAEWNPRDGGEFGKLLARLTVDANGRRADQPGFDPKNVKQYGLIIDGSGIDAFGQGTWSPFAGANGFRFSAPWSNGYRYDDPKLAEALQWLVDASLKQGISAPVVETSKLGGGALFKAGKGALIVDGSWMIGWYLSQAPFKVGFAMLPKGPAGRKSMFNGLADSIWTGSKHQKEAWEWVKFLGSPECQDIVAAHGVVFPAVARSSALMKEVYAKRGADVSAFLDEAKPETTFVYPVTDHASQVMPIMKTALDKIFLGQVDARSELARANKDVNALFN